MNLSRIEPAQILQLARDTLDIEAQALLGLKVRLGDSFVLAVQRILGITGRVVVMGMGKSGHVGRKLAATLASTGTPAFFCTPCRSQSWRLGHGDARRCGAGPVQQRRK